MSTIKFKLKDTPTVGVPNKKTGLPSLHIIAFPHYNKPDDFYRYILGGGSQGKGINFTSTPNKLISTYFLIKKCKPNKMFLVNMEQGDLEETSIKADKNTDKLYVKKEGKSIVLFYFEKYDDGYKDFFFSFTPREFGNLFGNPTHPLEREAQKKSIEKILKNSKKNRKITKAEERAKERAEMLNSNSGCSMIFLFLTSLCVLLFILEI